MQLEEGELILNVASDKDLLSITGTASLSGTLKINFLEGYVPSEDVVLMTYNKWNKSTFTALEMTGLPEGYNAKLVYEEEALHLVNASK